MPVGVNGVMNDWRVEELVGNGLGRRLTDRWRGAPGVADEVRSLLDRVEKREECFYNKIFGRRGKIFWWNLLQYLGMWLSLLVKSASSSLNI